MSTLKTLALALAGCGLTALPASSLPASALPAQSAAAAEPLVRFGPFSFQVGGLASPAAVVVADDGHIFVVEEIGCRVRVFGPEGVPRRSFGRYGSQPGELCDPRGIALGPDGRLYVADTGNHRVQVFEKDGTFVRTFGRRGSQPGTFHDPLGVAVSETRVAVADSGNHRVQVFLMDGQLEQVLGGFGRDEGRFVEPADVAFDERGELFVTDRGNHRVQRFRADGTLAKTWGDRGPYLGLLADPEGLAVHGGRLFVADTGNHRIQVFDAAGKVRDEWGLHALAPRQGEGRFHYPNQIAIAPSGEFCVVLEGFENRFQVFVPGERPEPQSFDQQRSDAPEHYGRMVSARGRLCAVAEPGRPSALLFEVSGEDAIKITSIGRYGSKYGQLVAPVDAELHPTRDELVVADPATARLSFFRLNVPPADNLRQDPLMARFVRSLDLVALSADPRWDAPLPIEPGALEYDDEGDLWLLDPRASRVVRIAPDLTIAGVFGDPRTLRGPTDLALSENGQSVYVVDARDRQVKVFDRDGRFERAFGRPAEPGQAPTGDRFARPFGVQAGGDGFVYVSDEGADSVVKFDERGTFVSRFGTNGLGASEFQKPAGLAQDGKGRLFVLDWGNHRAQVFHPSGGFVDAFGPYFFLPK